MTQTIFDTALKWLVTATCAGCAGAVLATLKTIKAIKDGVQCMLRSEIIRDHKEYTTKGFCPLYVKEALIRTYHAYHRLGGNDIATQKYEEIMRLPDYPAEVDK